MEVRKYRTPRGGKPMHMFIFQINGLIVRAIVAADDHFAAYMLIAALRDANTDIIDIKIG
jgi:hypothetical protein